MSNMPLTPGLMISAPSSGTGKTMLMLGLLAALRAREIRVQPFKSGPDYIDPAFHLAAAGQPSFNLDSWAMGQAQIVAHLQGREPADLVLAEGSMGLFDGVASPGEHGIGASAEIAMMTGWPVLLVLDVSGQAQSAAAIAHGFATLAPDLPFAGVVLNRVASPRHEALIREGMARAGIAVLGSLPRRGNIELPERHLGLVQAEETRICGRCWIRRANLSGSIAIWTRFWLPPRHAPDASRLASPRAATRSADRSGTG